MESVDPTAAEPLKSVRRFFKVVLFRYPQVNNRFCRCNEIVVDYRVVARSFDVEVCQSERIAKRIYFILALPYPRVVERQIVCMTVTVSLNVERVGVGVDSYVRKLSHDQSPYNRADFGVVLCQRQVVCNLSGRVPEPHRRNVARVKKC